MRFSTLANTCTKSCFSLVDHGRLQSIVRFATAVRASPCQFAYQLRCVLCAESTSFPKSARTGDGILIVPGWLRYDVCSQRGGHGHGRLDVESQLGSDGGDFISSSITLVTFGRMSGWICACTRDDGMQMACARTQAASNAIIRPPVLTPKFTK